MVLANINALNNDDPQFYKRTFENIYRFSLHYYIVGGDFNLAMNTQIDRQGSYSNNDPSAAWINTFIQNNELVDIWWFMNKDKLDFTWRKSNPRSIFSWLDYFLISESMIQFIKNVKILPSFKSDHSPVLAEFRFEPFSRGPGYWKFNTSLAKDLDYIEKISKLIEIEKEVLKHLPIYGMQWEVLKLAVRGSTVQYTACKKKSNNNKLVVLERKLKQLEDEAINQSYSILKDTEHQISLIKHDIEEINRASCKGAIIRSRARRARLGEKPTKYFLRLEKANYQKKTIYSLRNSKGTLLHQEQDILNEIWNFYNVLYSTAGHINKDYVKKLKIPKISNTLWDELEEPFTVNEITMALSDLVNGKCPSTDRLDPTF